MARKTAGQLSLKARYDTTIYDEIELSHALTEDIAKQLEICIRNHNPIFDEEEYCVGYVLASDPLLYNIMRRKYFAMLYLPSPRPEQTIFLYNKKKDQITKRLWCLPNAAKMAILSQDPSPPQQYRQMKGWCDAFFKAKFWPYIRKEHKISMPSEIEYLNLHRQELIDAGCQEAPPGLTEAFDFGKINIQHVENTTTALTE